MPNVQNVPGRSRLALSRYPSLHVSSLDEVAALYSSMAAAVRLREVSRRGPFAWRFNYLTLGPLVVAATDNSSGVRADCTGASDAYLLSIPLGEPSAESTIGKVVTPVVRGKSGLLCGPWQDSEVRAQPNFQVLQLIVPRKVLLTAMRTLAGTEPRELHFNARFVLDSPQAEPFLRLINYMLREAEFERPEFAAPGAGERLAEALIFRLLLSQPHSESALFSAPSRPATPRHVRRAAEYIDAHFEQPITMAELTRVAGVSVRSLQGGFQKHRGCSPLELVRARRLERARVLLLTSDTVKTVSEVAHLAGIEHLGRFSVRYRQRFGESPVRTLARRWGRFEAQPQARRNQQAESDS